jgi:hypothetical protein
MDMTSAGISTGIKLRLDPALEARLREFARLTDRTLNGAIAKFVREGLERFEGDPSPGHSVKA